MGELSEDGESSAPVTAGEDGQAGSSQPDRPKLVALPGPTVEPTATANDADADRLALERSLSGPPGQRIASEPANTAARTIDSAGPAPAAAHAAWAPPTYGAAESIALTATPELVQALRAELVMRARAEAGLRARAVDAETRLATRVLLSQRTAEALRLVRSELDQLGGLLTDERARRQAAEQRVAELEQQLAADRGRSHEAAVEIAALRDSLQQLSAPTDERGTAALSDVSPGAPPSAGAEVQADRLNDALTRLRAGAEPIDPVPAPDGPPTPAAGAPVTAAVTAIARPATLARPFRTLCRRDPALAGKLALSLLPMQWIAYPQSVSYDLVLGPGHSCVQVTSDDDGTTIVRHATARSLGQVDFQLVGGPERFAKLLAAGRIRRRLGFWVLSRVRGNRDGLAALDALLALPLDLPALVDGQTSMDPSILAQLQLWIKRAQSE